MVFVLNGGAEHGVDPRWCEVNHDAGDPTHEGSCEVALTEKFESIKDEDTSVMVEKVVSESSAISLGSLSAGNGLFTFSVETRGGPGIEGSRLAVPLTRCQNVVRSAIPDADWSRTR